MFKIVFSTLVLALAVGIKAERIQPRLAQDKCLDVRGDVLANGTPVQIYECNGTPAQNWILPIDSGVLNKIQLEGTNFCLDAGSDPANGVGLKIWECFGGLPAQAWFLTPDSRIVLSEGGFCMDLTNGNTADGTQIQIWQCTTSDVNQEWVMPDA